MASKEELKKLLEERTNRFITTSNLQEPDYVPILSQINTYAISFCGKTLWDVFDNFELERECYKKVHEAFYHDGLRLFGLNYPFKTFMDVGSKTYFVSENQVTIQHKETANMQADEYEELFSDPVAFIANKIAARKIPGFAKSYPDNLETVEMLFSKMDEFSANSKINRKYALEELGMPIVSSRSAPNPCDNFFDFIRGFKGTVTDIRRMTDKVEKAVEILTPYYEKSIPSSKEEAFPWLLCTCHIPTFLSKSQFERLYWPYMKRCLYAAYEAGTKYMTVLEGSWKQHMEFFEDIPKGSLVALVNTENLFEMKKRFGDRMTFCGGMPIQLLKYGTKQQCLDRVKEVYDIMAPGGGFIFMVEKPLIGPGDVNEDNFRAVNEFAHEYGRY